ncbi:MAG: TIGR02444 family protein [Pseudomonadota bacterium]
MTNATTPPQWTYALRTYARPGVADACLQLQARCNVDVVVMLHAMYAFDKLGVRLDADTLAAADAHVRAWREQVTVPLRALRTALKGGFSALPASAVEAARQKIKIAELEAESAAFAALAPFTGGTPARGGDTAQAETLLDAVVALYAAAVDNGSSGDAPAKAAVRTLSMAICASAPGLDRPVRGDGPR